MKTLYLGTDLSTGEDICLNRKWLETHLEIVGPPGSGKTRFLLHLHKELACDENSTVVVFNPKGSFGRMARDWTIAHGLAERLVMFDPAPEEMIIGYNPLRPNGLKPITQVKAACEAVRAAWGQSNFDSTPLLRRLMMLSFGIVRSLELTLIDAVDMLKPKSPTRAQALRVMAPGYFRDQLSSFDQLPATRQDELSSSTLSRIDAFVNDDTIRRILMQRHRALDLAAVIREHKLLIVNLEQHRPLRPDDVRLLGRFILNDLLSHAFNRPEGERSPIYLIVDEVQVFATEDLCTALDQGRELGLHIVMAHQYPSQLRNDSIPHLFDSVMNCVRTKMVFGGVAVNEIEQYIAKEFAIDDFDPMAVKDEIIGLEIEPVETTRVVEGETLSKGFTRTHSEGETHGESYAMNRGHSSAINHSHSIAIATGFSVTDNSSETNGTSGPPSGQNTESFSNTDGSAESFSQSTVDSEAYGESYADSESETHGVNMARQVAEATGESETKSISRTRVPFYENIKRRKVTSRTFESEQEFLTKALQKFHMQPLGCYAIKVPLQPTRFVRAPWIDEPWLDEADRDEALRAMYAQPFYSTREQVDAEEAERLSKIPIAPQPKVRRGTIREILDVDHQSGSSGYIRPQAQAQKKLPKPPTR